jgi:regulator of sigma E protease
VPDSPAALAGVQPGDRLVALAGAALEGIDALQRQLDAGRIGQELTLQLLRRSDLISLKIKPTELRSRS